jgi:hypothetical protein
LLSGCRNGPEQSFTHRRVREQFPVAAVGRAIEHLTVALLVLARYERHAMLEIRLKSAIAYRGTCDLLELAVRHVHAVHGIQLALDAITVGLDEHLARIRG